MEHKGSCAFTPTQSAGGAGVRTGPSLMSLSVMSTTGSPVELTVPREETLEHLRTRISQKLRLQTDRMELVHRDRHLTAGNLLDQGVRDGSKLTLLPLIETCSASSTPTEMTIMDKLERLTDFQINDFLSGGSPLALSVGTGAHTVYLQLQLSRDVKKLLEDEDSQVQGSCELKSDSRIHLNSSGFKPSQTSSASPLSDRSASPHSTQRTRCSPDSPTRVPPVDPSLLHHTPSLSGVPHLRCPQQAVAPVCSDRTTSSIPEPLGSAAASAATQHDGKSHLRKQPGAVIDSCVSRSPGIFSGTFSGTLVPSRQSSVIHPRPGIAVILQILNDLLGAAYHHQGAVPPPPPALHHCSVTNHPGSRLSTEESCKARPPTHRKELRGDDGQLPTSSLEENKRLQCKLEHLQILMHGRRLRRRTRRRSHLHRVTCQNQQRHHCS